ncbi:MAG: glycosyltransferase [Calditrichaceae bacterium]
MTEHPVISIIIVNYNVRDFLEQALNSAKRALKKIPSEIFVVDNASIDGSVAMVKQRFPDIRLIESKKNVGFSAGNNLALKKAKGKYIVLLNPDTVIQEDTFRVLLEFFESTPDATAATCKIINPDGSFSVDCRHSIPTPMTALWKIIGFNKLFPNSKIFGRYNLTFLDENKISEVEAISGSFMMLKRDIIDQIGELDEDFFMYCEDIDYCHRINEAGGKIYYVPTSQIIHYKGESTKKNNLDYVVTFNRSLYQFYKKHYQQKYLYPLKWIILLGTIFRGAVIFLRNNIKFYHPVLIDLIILNLVMFTSFYIRYTYKHNFSLDDFFSQYVIINIITSVMFFIASLFFESTARDRHSISKIMKINFATYIIVAAITFFFNMFAFSRMVVLISAVFTSIFMIGWRVLVRIFAKKPSSILGKRYFSKRSLIVGFDKETKQLINKLGGLIPAGIEFIGVVSDKEKDIGKKLGELSVVSSIDKLPQYIEMQKVDLVIFTTHNIPFQTILTTMSRVNNTRIEYKMVPGHLEFMIGKSVVERLDSIPLVDIEYAYGKPFNILAKRIFDLILSLMLLIFLSPVILFLIPFNFSKITRQKIFININETKTILKAQKNGILNFILMLINVLTGKLSFVGAPVRTLSGRKPYLDYKPGVTGIVQINQNRIQNSQAEENFELHYLKNQNLFMDSEILFQAILQKFNN